MIFARRVFQAAAIWGIVVIALAYAAYFLNLGGEGTTVYPDRPEFVHGFFLVTFAWQIAFLIIATDPVRYRLLMLAAMLEKFPFTLAVLALYALGAVGIVALVVGLVDGVLGILFSVAYVVTDSPGDAE